MKRYAPFLLLLFFLGTSCTEKVTIVRQTDQTLPMIPDYSEVTIPCNIAPLNFGVDCGDRKSCLLIKADHQELQVAGSVKGFQIPLDSWQQLLQEAKGKELTFTVCLKEEEGWTAYKPFSVHIAPEPIDAYLAYRRIAPGYEIWGKMGIYQRDLTSFTETAVLENSDTENNCMNCHSFCQQNPEKLFFHLRKQFASSILTDGDQIEKLDTETDKTLSAMVYPSWHPGGNYIASSVNNTRQTFHSTDANRIEVYDMASDVVVYDIHKRRLLTTPLLSSAVAFETFPTFSADGKTLYFCSADSCDMPAQYNRVKYSICSIGFNDKEGSFGTSIDTLCAARQSGKSASFPRVSPNGKWLLYTQSAYGNFSIWHKDADLRLIDLDTRKELNAASLNSPETESYHSWSSNSHWIVFSSRRLDGLYTRLYIAHVSADGEVAHPFVLPQEEADYYTLLMQSYNIPEFITGKIDIEKNQLLDHIKNGEAEKITVVNVSPMPGGTAGTATKASFRR